MAESLRQALLEIQRNAPKIQKDGFNPYTESRFMQLDTVLEKVLPLLNEHEILWQTLPSVTLDGKPALEYTFFHVPTKEEIARTMPLALSKGTPQDQGSAITYARRYALVAALNLVADKDDDGHAATEAAKLPDHKPQTQEPLAAPTEDQQLVMRQAITDLTTELKKHKQAWAQTVQWAKERSITLETPPADKLRAVERALRTKLERVEAEAAKKK